MRDRQHLRPSFYWKETIVQEIQISYWFCGSLERKIVQIIAQSQALAISKNIDK